jgi:hypothetical protein
VAKAQGWAAAEARMHTRRGPARLRVHEACVADGDERLGLSALTKAMCDRCRKRIEGPGVVVQRAVRAAMLNP